MPPMEFLTSPRLSEVPGLVHGFGRRIPGDRETARRSARETFADVGDVYFLRQMHGCVVAVPPWSDPPEADASLTAEAGVLLAIETADCLPVLIVDPLRRRIAAAHAGWRGTAAKIAKVAAARLVADGSDPATLVAALGPAIGACCYEVGDEVGAAFGPEGARFFAPGGQGRKHLDLVAANRAQLEAAGLRAGNIDALNLCTRCRVDLFFSYRRDGARAGRMISAVGFSRP